MKVALANESFSPQYDGVAVCAENYARIINRDYGTAYVITPAHQDRKKEDFPFEVIEYSTSKLSIADQYKFGLPISPKLLKRLNELPVDLFHSHCPFITGILAGKLAKKRGLPHISTFHSKYKDDVNQRIKINFNLPGEMVSKYVASFYERCDYVWTLNKGTARTLREYGYKGDITIMPNGCDMPATYRDDAIRSAMAKEYGLDNDKPILLFVGRLTYLKNIHTIIKALGALNRQGCEFSMLFVGGGEDEVKAKQLVIDQGLEDRIKFAGKIMDRVRLSEIYSSCDLFAFPSIYDNAPLVVREAAACGCASLLIKDSNSAEDIVNMENGVLAENTVEDITIAIYNALYNSDLKKMGKNARETIYMSWDAVLELVTKEYERILTKWELDRNVHKSDNSISISRFDILNDFNLKLSDSIKDNIKNIKRKSR